MSINTRSTSKKGFTHFELVLLVIVVAIIASAGLYILNYNKNNSKANASDLIASSAKLYTADIDGNTNVSVMACKFIDSNNSTRVNYFASAKYKDGIKPEEPPIRVFLYNRNNASVADFYNNYIDFESPASGSSDIYFDSNNNTYPDTSLTHAYAFGENEDMTLILVDRESSKRIATVNLPKISLPTCYSDNFDNTDLKAQDSASTVNTTPIVPKTSSQKTTTGKPKVKVVSGKNKTAQDNSSLLTAKKNKIITSGGGAAPGTTSATTKKYPYAFSNFTRVHHLYKKNVANPKASNYDILWSDSKKQVLIIQYRVNIFAGSGLKPGLFYSNIYNGTPSAATRIASFAVTDPISKGESNSPLQTGSTEEIASVKNKMETAEAVNGRYWGEVHITKAQMKGKNILYFAVGYDPQGKEKQPDYSYVQAIDVDKVGWYNKTTDQQPRIRK